jgi:hypothetical protein
MLVARIAFSTSTHSVLSTKRVLWDQKVAISLDILKLALNVLLVLDNVVEAQVAIFSLLSLKLDLDWLERDMLDGKVLSLEMNISSVLLHSKLIRKTLL